MTQNTSPAGSGDHAALMDRVYRHQRHIYDLTRKYYLLGRDRMLAGMAVKPGERVIEIGCGTARNLIGMAKLYPQARLYGLDASAEMLRTAEEAISRAKIGPIVLKQGYAERLTPALFDLDGPFDHAVFSYSLSMIPDWRGAMAAAARSVRPGGTIHVVDFGDLKGLWRPAERLLRGWLGLFHVTPRDELLKSVENAGPGATLHILTGRYAFVLRAGSEAAKTLALPRN